MGDKCEHNFDYIGGNEWCCTICDEVLYNDDYQEWLSSKQAEHIQHLEQRLAEVEKETLSLARQVITDLNLAHKELMLAQNIDDYEQHSWPEWSSPAHTIEWAKSIIATSEVEHE